MPGYYPIMLDVRERPVVVIGGDRVAAGKAAALADCGALVTVISPEFDSEMLSLAEHQPVRLRRKNYEPGDLAGAFVVVAVTTNKQVIEAIWQETQQRGQPVNIVDVPRSCSFILPSILRRGKLTVAVSTEGASPSLAKRVRQQLEEVLPPACESLIDLAALARVYLRESGISYQERDEFFRAFMDSALLDLLNAGEITQALQLTAGLLHNYGIEIAPDELAREFRKEAGDVAFTR